MRYKRGKNGKKKVVNKVYLFIFMKYLIEGGLVLSS